MDKETRPPMEDTCPECGEHDLTRELKDYTFGYGCPPATVELTCPNTPVYTCNNKKCRFAFMNWESFDVTEVFIKEWKKKNGE